MPIPFYQWMKKKRQGLDLNLKDLRDLTEITVSRLSDIERGRKLPTEDEAQIIVMGMGLGWYSSKDEFVMVTAITPP